jgi:hypothetical protein
MKATASSRQSTKTLILAHGGEQVRQKPRFGGVLFYLRCHSQGGSGLSSRHSPTLSAAARASADRYSV